MSHEPALRFWLSYVEHHGALFEDRGDEALVVLTPQLRAAFSLPEEVTVTSDPEASREDGALLLIPGHPLIDQAVEAMLRTGDAGYRYLPWPRSAPPDGATLLVKARDAVSVAHGRIDPGGEPTPVYLPLLHIGAQVHYRLGEHFQEREEVWVDAREARELPEGIRSRLNMAGDSQSADASRPVLQPVVLPALQVAEAALQARAARREQELLSTVQEQRQAELDRARAYYAAVLTSIEQRRTTAPPARQAVLEAQADATRLERDRRLAEIEEKFRPHHEVQPFRLHLVLAPALHVPVKVRRGERCYDLALGWLLHASAFGPVRCPHCGSDAPLVASRERLGCERCLNRPAAAGPAPSGPRVPAPAPERPEAASAGTVHGDPRAKESQQAAGPAAGGVPDAPGPSMGAGPKASLRAESPRRDGDAAAAPNQTPDDYLVLRQRVRKIGESLAFNFWSRVCRRKSWPATGFAPDGPLAALYRLYGSQGPLIAVGLPPGRLPVELTSATADPDPLGRAVTTGTLSLGALEMIDFPYTLRWHFVRGTAVLVELLPFPEVGSSYLPTLKRLPAEVAQRLTRDVPRPRTELDGVAQQLCNRVVPVDGLPLALRCLSSWCNSADLHAMRPQETGDDLVAVAVAAEVGRASGLRRTRTVIASQYGVDPGELAQAVRRIRPLLRHPWGA